MSPSKTWEAIASVVPRKRSPNHSRVYDALIGECSSLDRDSSGVKSKAEIEKDAALFILHDTCICESLPTLIEGGGWETKRWIDPTGKKKEVTPTIINPGFCRDYRRYQVVSWASRSRPIPRRWFYRVGDALLVRRIKRICAVRTIKVLTKLFLYFYLDTTHLSFYLVLL